MGVRLGVGHRKLVWRAARGGAQARGCAELPGDRDEVGERPLVYCSWDPGESSFLERVGR